MFNKRTGRLSRFLDRSVGVFLLFFLSLFIHKRRKPQNPQSFCFIKTGGMGDMVLLSAVIGQIRLKFPSALMTVVCSAENKEAAELLTDCRVVSVSHRNFVRCLSLKRMQKCDVAIDFGAWARFDAVVSLLVPAQFRVGFKTLGQYRHFCYDQTVSHSSALHELDNYYKLAKDYCLKTGLFPKFETKTVSGYENTVFLHMYCAGARFRCRMWAYENWEKLAKLLKSAGFYLAFTSSGAESVHLKAFLRSKGIDALIISDRPLRELASLLASCRGVVSVNCGISHLASACGADVVELTGAVNPERWGTLGGKTVRVVPAGVKKMLCYGFENSADEDSMNSVSAEDVMAAVKKSISL